MASGRSLLASKVAWAGAPLLILSSFGAGPYEAIAYGTHPTSETLRWQNVVEHLSDGDLVFRTGRDIMSRLVLSQGHSSRFSHVGVVLKRQSGLVVVHALPRNGPFPGGVLVESLTVFAATDSASDIGFYRIKGVKPYSRNRVREYVLRQIGKPFDDDFLLSEDKKLYCTELVLKALDAAEIGVTTSVPQIHVMLIAEPVVTPDYLSKSSQLEAILPNTAVHVSAAQ